MRRLLLALLLVPSLAWGYSGSGGIWAEKSGDFVSKNFPGTASGIQAAVSYLGSTGGMVTVWPGTYAFGTSQLTIPSGHVIIQGHGQRDTKLTFSGTGSFIVLGADDGNHSGAAAYNGTASYVFLRDLWIQGPGKTTATVGITDWESGSNSYRDLIISDWGTGYYGIGADVSEFQQIYFSSNGRAVQLGSRCDQNEFRNCYFASNSHGIYNEWAYGMRVFGGQFVFQDSSDITYDVTAAPTNSGDVRVGSQRADINGTWFEYLASPAHHINLGINGTSARYLTGLTVTGCNWFGTNTDTLVSVQAFSDVSMFGNGYGGSAATLLRVNPVSGWQPIVHDFMNHMSSAITPLVGTGDTSYVYRVEPAYSGTGWVFKPKVTIPGSIGTIGFPTTGDRIEFSGSGANLLNATAGQLRLMAANVYRLEANSSGIDIGNGYLNFTGSLGSINQPSAGNEMDLSYGGTNIISATNAAGVLSLRAAGSVEKLQLNGTGADVTGRMTASDSGRFNLGFRAGGRLITRIDGASASLNFGVPAAVPGSVDLTLTVNGAVLGNRVAIGAPVTIGANYLLTGFVSGANTVTIRWTQIAGAAADPDGGGGSYTADILQ